MPTIQELLDLAKAGNLGARMRLAEYARMFRHAPYNAMPAKDRADVPPRRNFATDARGPGNYFGRGTILYSGAIDRWCLVARRHRRIILSGINRFRCCRRKSFPRQDFVRPQSTQGSGRRRRRKNNDLRMPF